MGISAWDKAVATDISRLKKHGGNISLLADSMGVKSDCIVDYSSNINPYGPPDSVKDAVRRAVDGINCYPEQQAESFVSAAAEHLGIDKNTIVPGNGSIELIYLVPQLLRVKKAFVLVPSFTEYELSLLKAGVDIEYKSAFMPAEAIGCLEAVPGDADMVVIGNPNNPCGYTVEKNDLLDLIKRNTKCTWVVDEAFIDFVIDGPKRSLVREATQMDNLIVLHSLTKMYSIPGLRLGYLVASPQIAATINEDKYPWSINSIAMSAGIAALKDREFQAGTMQVLYDEALRLYEAIRRIDGISPYKPSANYILIRVEKQISSTELQEALIKKGFAIRDCSSYTGLNDRYIRIAVKHPEDNSRLLEALRDVLNSL